jgi:hypothetical protein
MISAHHSTSYLFFAGCFGAVKSSDADPGSDAFLTPGPGSGIRNRFFPDPGSQTHIFESLGTHFVILLKTGPNVFLQHFKNKIIFNIVEFGTKKKGMTTIFFTSLFCCWLDP